MATYTYPASDYDKAKTLLGILGSHWTNVYGGNFLVGSYAYSRAQEEIQAYQDLLETVASVSRIEVPIYHTDNWYFLTIRESDSNTRVLKYGEGADYGDGHEYGGTGFNVGYTFPITADLKDVRTILNRLTDPSRTLVSGIDFFIEDGTISFAADPFADDRISKRDLYEGSDVVDREAGLWVFKGQFDWDHIYEHFGYVLNLRLESSTEYRNLVNAILDALVQGTACEHVQQAIAAITGVPVVVEAEETVELVQKDNRNLVIVTDANVYKFNRSATAIVAVGDTVTAGQQLTDVVTIYDLNRGEIPSDISAVTVGLGFLPGGFVDGLTFSNKDVDLESEVIDGKLKVSFELGGFPTDVDAFWDLVHARGLSKGTTLANYLDVRGLDTNTDTNVTNLPTTVNPLEFLIENVLRNNAYIVRIKVGKTLGSIALSNTRLFRKVVPPWTAMIVLLELDIADDPVIMDSSATEEDPGYVESLGLFTGMEPIEESIYPDANIEEAVTIRLVSGVCT